MELPDGFVCPRKIKVDVGMSRCPMYSWNWLDHEPDLFVFGFEPNPNAISEMKKNNAFGKHWDRVHIFPVALGNVDEPRTLDFHIIKDWELSSSLYAPKQSFLDHYTLEIEKTIQVPVHPLSDFFKLLPDDVFIEYIKIDAQGADLDIVKSGSKDLSEKVAWVTLEADAWAYENCPDTAENIHKFMTSIGFVKVDHPNTHDPTYFNSKFASRKDDIYICQT